MKYNSIKIALAILMLFSVKTAYSAEVASVKIMCINSAGAFIQQNPAKEDCYDQQSYILLVKTVGNHNNQTLQLATTSAVTKSLQKIENLWEPGYQFFKINLCELGDNSSEVTMKVSIGNSFKTIKYTPWCGD